MIRRNSSARVPVLLFGFVAAALPFAASAQVPAQSQPQPPVTAITAYVPGQDLRLVAAFDGIDAHADAWKQTAASRILGDTTMGALIDDLVGQALDRLSAGPNRKVTREDLQTIARHLWKAGALVAVHDPDGKPATAATTIVFRDAFRAEVRPAFARLIGSLGPPEAKPKVVPMAGKRQVVETEIAPGRARYWWVEKERDVVLVSGKAQLDRTLAALDGQTADLSKDAAWEELGRGPAGYEPLLTAFLNVPKVDEPEAVQLGLDGLRRVDFRVGMQGEAIVNSLGIDAPAPRRGLLTLLDQPGFTTDTMPALPEGVGGFTILSLDVAKAYDRLVAALKAASTALPAAGPGADQGLAGALQTLDSPEVRKQIDELARPLGPTAAFYLLPDPKAAAPAAPLNAANPMAALTGLLKIRAVLTVDVADPPAFVKALDKVMGNVNKQLKELADSQTRAAQAQAGGDAQVQAPLFEFKRVGVGANRTYLMTLPTAYVALGATIKPTVKTGKSHVVLATAPDLAQQTLDLLEGGEKAARWSPADQVAHAFEQLPPKLIFLNLNDPRDALPATLQALPALLQNAATAAAAGGPPGAPPVRIDPNLIPDPAALRAQLFPSVSWATVDDRGLRFDSRQAFFITDMAGTGVASALLLPAVQSAREASRRQMEGRQAPPGQAPPGQAPPGQAPPGQAVPGRIPGDRPPVR